MLLLQIVILPQHWRLGDVAHNETVNGKCAKVNSKSGRRVRENAHLVVASESPRSGRLKVVQHFSAGIIMDNRIGVRETDD